MEMKIAARILVMETVIGSVLFVAAGRVDLPWFWAILVVHTTLTTIGLHSVDPDLIRERLRPGPGAREGKARLIAIPLILGHLVVAGLDVGRFGWTGPMPIGVRAAALATYGAGMALSYWAMATNRFFSSVIRIQTDRGQHVVTGGPYRFVRHPGYTGMLIASISGGVALGSLWSLVPMIVLVALCAKRTLLEDGVLHRELDGYADYASRVGSRLIPGVW